MKLNELLFFLFLATVFSSCVTTKQELDPKVYYTRDLLIKVDGQRVHGVGVIPNKESFKFRIISDGKMDLLVLETCHREQTLEKVGRRETYVFKRVGGEEDRSDCSYFRLTSFEHHKGRHAYGFIAIENEGYTLPAKVKCNGKVDNYSGTSVCQAKEGLYQTIEFNERVKIYQDKCEIKGKDVRKSFRFKMPNRACRFTFQNEKGERHLLYTEGYEQILVRN